MTAYRVVLSPEAVHDIVTIHEWIADRGDETAAHDVREHLIETCATLRALPHRGRIPPELRTSGTSYREVRWKPYRVIYRVGGEEVFVLAVLDERRDIRELLRWRLLR